MLGDFKNGGINGSCLKKSEYTPKNKLDIVVLPDIQH